VRRKRNYYVFQSVGLSWFLPGASLIRKVDNYGSLSDGRKRIIIPDYFYVNKWLAQDE